LVLSELRLNSSISLSLSLSLDCNNQYRPATVAAKCRTCVRFAVASLPVVGVFFFFFCFDNLVAYGLQHRLHAGLLLHDFFRFTLPPPAHQVCSRPQHVHVLSHLLISEPSSPHACLCPRAVSSWFRLSLSLSPHSGIMSWSPQSEPLGQLAQFLKDSLNPRDKTAQKNAELVSLLLMSP
jgi:hypothetical protein